MQSTGDGAYWSLDRLKRSYTDYISSKTQEVNEQQDSRRYRHASQWTAEQIKIFNKRKQPIVTYNRIGRKIDGVIGLIEKLKQSPKAFPRTPNEEGAAALATAVVRSVLDGGDWKHKSYIAGQNAAIDGFGGIELLIEPGDTGDPDVSFEMVENDGFFYDPRSIRLDFTDCRYMGQGKWLDLDQAREMYPDQADKLEDAMESGTDLSTNSDREQKWFITDGKTRRIRIIDLWYIMNGEWCWCQFTGNMKLKEGKSWFHDEKGKTFCKYIMFSAQVDQDGDRYGFVRNLKSAQDEINQRRSKALHLLNTRRIIAEEGAFTDVEVTRREAARPDGIVIRNKGFEAEFDDGAKNQEIQAHLEFLVDAKSEIENFGPNPALIGQGSLGDKSGRAISLLQQAGIAELGPFLLAFRGWKIRLYRAIWSATREHWKQDRFIRVTDDQNVVQWLGVNQVGINPTNGMPSMVNHLGSLDVDIIMDEGPDSITMGVETYEALLAVAQSGANVPPEVIIELHPNLDPDTKKRILEKLNQPQPMQQIEEQQGQADIQKTLADTELSKAKAMDTMRGDQPAQATPKDMADMMNVHADTQFKQAQTMKTKAEAMLAPQQAMHDMEMGREQNVNARAKMAMDHHKSEADRASSDNHNDMDRMQNAYESERDHSQAAHESERDHHQAREDAELARKEKEPDHKLKVRQHEDNMKLQAAKLAIDREDREKDRKAQSEEKQRDREHDAEKTGFGPKRDKELTKVLTGFAKAFKQIDAKLDKLDTKIEEVAEDAKSPIEVVRGKDGRVSGVNKGKRKMTVSRDAKGRTLGIS